MRPWCVGLLEFMLPTVFSDYVQKTQPLIQVCVNQRCVNENVAKSALWMACQSVSDEVRSFFEDKLIAQALDWTLGREVDPNGSIYALLTGGTAKEPASLSISKIWLFSAALGANDLITNSLSRSIPPDQHIEEAVKNFEENRNVNEGEVVEFFKRIANVPLNTFRKYEKRLRKPLELIFNKGGEQLKRAAYEGEKIS
ncbi:unnamed protein product [Cylicostephanus goldi]|uniref:Uncharacterized protein n=1 Tax=Cylicostephanus goldi TaxID=71465 RepID=A0A3P6RDZ0_CYLGO|nr:unnamed protein product [Cylicostephanus goldi]